MSKTLKSKFVEYDGIRFYLDDKSGYYKSSHFSPPKCLHRYVWESRVGEIPIGFEIHHKDQDKTNNALENLECISKELHHQIHAATPSNKLKAYRSNEERKKEFIRKSRLWHKSDEGRKWHQIHALQCKQQGWHKPTTEVNCLLCGKAFMGDSQTKFCCKAHKAKWRRLQHLDDEVRVCERCGTKFITCKFKSRKFCDACKSKVISQRALNRASSCKPLKEAICSRCHKTFLTTSKKPWQCPQCHKDTRKSS